MNNDELFSETEDTKLKRFLTGGRVYSQLAVAVICGLVFLLTMSGIIGIYHNCSEAKNICDLTGLDVNRDLNGQYVQGNAYKFLAKHGHIAESERAATHFYYFMYTDAADGNQYVTLVEAPKEADAQIQTVIADFLQYVQQYSSDSSATYQRSMLENMTGRFKNMTSQEKEMTEESLQMLGLTNEQVVGYTLKVGKLPKGSDTVGYWFIAVPFGIAAAVGLVLFLYGLHLENLRYEANKSPYPYQNRKKK